MAHQAETAYAKQVLADTEGLQEELYKELRGRIQEADQSVPLRCDLCVHACVMQCHVCLQGWRCYVW